MKMFSSSIFLALALLLSVGLGGKVVVKTKCGDVVGLSQPLPSLSLPTAPEAEVYSAFYGIPFALPPVGKRRFRPAERLDCWNGTLDATQLKPACHQFFPMGDCPQGESEDCLTLNVYVPKTNSSRPLPVHFWIYGGSNVVGFQTSYPGVEQLVRAGTTDGHTPSAIVVTPNYRLGAFGYLALKELSETDPRGVSGNYAITDLVRALEWTNEHISSFGGDPGRVNLIGQSSGGTNIFALLACPQAKGLFHSTISLSGSPRINMSLKEAEAQDREILEAYGCAPPQATVALNSAEPEFSVLDCLFSLPAEVIAKKLPQAYGDTDFLPESRNSIGWKTLVIVDGVTVAHAVMDALALPVHDVPNIFQTLQCDTEMLMANTTQHDWSVRRYKDWLAAYLHSKGWSQDAGRVLTSLYRDYEESAELMFEGWLSDMGATCGNRQLGLASVSRAQSPNYLGFVARGPDNTFYNIDNRPTHYSGHLWDYIAATEAWGFMQTVNGSIPAYQPTDGDRRFGRLLRQIWGAFLTHDAHFLVSVGWQPIGSEGVYGVLNRDDGVMSTPHFMGERCSVLAAPPLEMGEQFYWVN